MPAPTCVGARRCLARRAAGVATSVACIARFDDPAGIVTIAPPEVCRPSGPAGQAPPDPYNMGDHPPPPGLPIPPPACCPNCVGARQRLARRTSVARQQPCRQPSRRGLRTPPWAPVRAAGSRPTGPAGQASPPGKSAHLGGARRRVACRTSVARQMGRHISDDADQCAAQPPHHRLPGRVLGIPTGSVTVRGENHRGHSPSRLQPAAGRRLSAANLLWPAARGDAPSQPPSGGLRIQPGASAPGALAPTPP
jgi:hypothetical protein